MPRCANPSKRRQNAVLLIFVYAALAGAWAWRLQQAPKQPKEDAQRMKNLTTVAAYLSKAPSEVIQPILSSLAMVSDAQLAKLKEWTQETPDQQLMQLTMEEQRLLGQGGVRDALLLAWLGHEKNSSSVESYLLIAAAGEFLDEDVKVYALETLAARAQRSGDAEGAITILERAGTLPKASWKTLLQLLDVCRASRKPTVALHSITEWIDRHPADETTPWLEEARDLEVSFMLQTGRAAEAFSGQLDLLRAAPQDHLPERTLDRARVCAQAANQSTRLLPWIERHLTHFNEDKLDWHALMKHAEIHPDYRRWLLQAASIAEVELPASRALDFCLRLAACGERGAITRVCALAAPAGRVRECEDFLACAADLPALRITVLEAAQQHEVARRVLMEKLRQRPQDRDLHYGAALAEAANKPGSTATVIWQSFLRRFPNDLSAQRRLLQSHMEANQPAMALRVLDAMNPASLTDEDRKQGMILRQL